MVIGEDSFVLDNGLSATVYHSSTSKMKRKIANLLAEYIVKVENNGNYDLTHIFYAGWVLICLYVSCQHNKYLNDTWKLKKNYVARS